MRGGNQLADKYVEFSYTSSVLSDSAQFAPHRQIWVEKNILVLATEDGDSANLLQFDQRFSQTIVPEPGTFTLLGSGLLAALWARRRGAKRDA